MVWKITIPDLKINLIGLEKIKSYILKLLFLLYAFLLNSCETKSEKSLISGSIYSTGIANEPSEPGSETRPETSTKLDFLDRHG